MRQQKTNRHMLTGTNLPSNKPDSQLPNAVDTTSLIPRTSKTQLPLDIWTTAAKGLTSLNRFSKNVLAFVMFFPIALAFQAKYEPLGSIW